MEQVEVKPYDYIPLYKTEVDVPCGYEPCKGAIIPRGSICSVLIIEGEEKRRYYCNMKEMAFAVDKMPGLKRKTSDKSD